MKKILFILICNIVCSSFLILEQTYAKTMDTREIKLKANQEKDDVRSILLIRTWLDGRTVYISSYDQSKTVSVVITDMEEEVVVTNAYPSSQVISIPICKAGKYQIEIHMNSKVYTGVFELE